MRCVARQATLVGLHRSVFKDKRPHGVGVTLGADRELSRRCTNLVAGRRSMRIMTVAALDESHIDAMTVRPGKFGFLRGMASIAELGLRFHQHEVNVLGAVGTVTAGASDAICKVFGLGEVLRFQAGLVTVRANRGGLSRAQGLKPDDFSDVAAAIYVGLSRSVTRLTTVLVAFEQCGMRGARKMLFPDLLVAGLANVGFGVLATRRTGKDIRALPCRGTCLRHANPRAHPAK